MKQKFFLFSFKQKENNFSIVIFKKIILVVDKNSLILFPKNFFFNIDNEK